MQLLTHCFRYGVREALTLLLLMRVLSFRRRRRESDHGQRLRVANADSRAFSSIKAKPALLRRGMQIAVVTERDLPVPTMREHIIGRMLAAQQTKILIFAL
ncbi:hypothetical protein [Bradyrhizobium ottawaense]|uniref:hypothetical protein n=1 Tax=Bradyrhizobium ottawaense TaxID=931866 RepID=UPI003F9F2E89